MTLQPRLIAGATGAIAFTLTLVAHSLWPEGERRRVPWTDLSPQVGSLTIARQTERVFRERRPFGAHVRGAGGTAPAVDFEQRQVLLVSPGPRSSTGYAVDVVSVTEHDGAFDVAVRERTPGVGDRVEPRVTFPYRLISLPAGKNVYVEWRGR